MSALSRQTPARPGSGPGFNLQLLLEQRTAAVMGILNVTPDSFSDGGRFAVPELALAHARRMIAEGADLIDIGAESTRPYVGAEPVDSDEELRRLAPVLPAVVELGTAVSIDTMKASVADWAFANGAAMGNDVWGLQGDPDMAAVVAAHGVPVVVMHNRASVDPAIDIIADMLSFFERTLAIASRAGIAADKIILDPGIGFGKTADQSMIALAKLDALHALGCPVLVGASRKRFIASVVPSEPQQRLGGSLAAHLIAVRHGAKIIRAHDVAETMQAIRVTAAIEDRQ